MQWYQDTVFIKFLNQRPSLKQFIKFSIVGGTGVVVDFVVYVFLTRVWHWQYLLAATISFIFAVTSNFILNRYWTFKVDSKNITAEYVKFFLVAVGGLIWTLFFLYIMVDIFGWYDLVAKIIVLAIVVNWSFWLQKYWTFKVK